MATPPPNHLREIVKLIERHRYERDTYTVFSDVCASMAYSISNSVDLRQREQREKRYMDIVGRYDKDTLGDFPKVMAEVVLALEERQQDILGVVFHELELHNKDRGQFFTAQHVCDLMAQMTVGDGEALRSELERKGFVTASEPAVGSGAMVIALAEAMRTQGINYQTQLHVTAIDVDERAAHMAYVQFSLLHIPAEVIVGNTFTGEVRERWFTPAHVLGGWNQRLGIHRAIETAIDLERSVEAAPAPTQPVDIELPTIGEQMSLLDLGGMDR